MTLDPSMLVAIIVALGNLGALAVLAKKYATTIDEHAKVIPVMVQTLSDINKDIAERNNDINELYRDRNSHDKRITKIEQTHRIKGCDQPILKESRHES